MLSDIILIILTVLASLLILGILVFYAYGKHNINLLTLLDIFVLVGIIYLLFLENNRIKKLENNPQNSQVVEDMNKYLTILSPLIPMVDKDGNPITYP
jgi:hypothetical protein